VDHALRHGLRIHAAARKFTADGGGALVPPRGCQVHFLVQRFDQEKRSTSRKKLLRLAENVLDERRVSASVSRQPAIAAATQTND
jgi:hypothetical protein